MDTEAGLQPIQENATLIRGPKDEDGTTGRPVFFDDGAHAPIHSPATVEKEHRLDVRTVREEDEEDVEDETETAPAAPALSPTPYTPVSSIRPTPQSSQSGGAYLDEDGHPVIMSDASRMFDREGKGYLDSTERALRRLDSDNDGKLTIHNVYSLMKSLQESQKLSNELMTTLQKEQKTSMNLKKAVAGLIAFAVLLSLANIGTSFAAARLAKDTEVSNGNLVAKGTEDRLGTTNKLTSQTLHMKPLDEGSRRRMEETGLDDCGIHFPLGDKDWQLCREEGIIEYDEALHLYALFCPAMAGPPNNLPCPSLENGIDVVLLVCDDIVNAIYGGAELPMRGPRTRNYNGISYTTFPTTYAGPNIPFNYEGVQYVPDPNGGLCPQSFEVSMTCPHTQESNGNTECFIFSTLAPPYCEIFDEARGGSQGNFTMCWTEDDNDEL